MGRPQKILKGPRKAPKGPQKVVEGKLQKEWSAQKWQAGKSLFWERPEAVDKVGDGFGQKTSRKKLNNFDNFFLVSPHFAFSFEWKESPGWFGFANSLEILFLSCDQILNRLAQRRWCCWYGSAGHPGDKDGHSNNLSKILNLMAIMIESNSVIIVMIHWC